MFSVIFRTFVALSQFSVRSEIANQMLSKLLNQVTSCTAKKEKLEYFSNIWPKINGKMFCRYYTKHDKEND